MKLGVIFCSSMVVVMTFGSCKLRKASDADPANNSSDAQVKQAHYVSCQKNDSGSTTRCVQYDLNGPNPGFIADWITGTCGQADKGFGGFAYIDGSCPSEGRLGECVANKPAMVYSDYYYSSGYSAESAAQACQESDGSWTTP